MGVLCLRWWWPQHMNFNSVPTHLYYSAHPINSLFSTHNIPSQTWIFLGKCSYKIFLRVYGKRLVWSAIVNSLENHKQCCPKAIKMTIAVNITAYCSTLSQSEHHCNLVLQLEQPTVMDGTEQLHHGGQMGSYKACVFVRVINKKVSVMVRA